MDTLTREQRYARLLDLVRTNFSPTTQRCVDDALEYADRAMDGQTRYDGTPMLDHAVRTAEIVISEIGLGRNSTVATILHDVVRLAAKAGGEELERVTTEIRAQFGDYVVDITRALANISDVKTKVAKEQADNFRDLIVSYSTDPRVILIKLADRLEVMRSLSIFPTAKHHKKSWESLNIYAPIAHKLGLYAIKSELEDISLSYLEPDDYQHILSKLEETSQERQQLIARFLEPIIPKLDKMGYEYHIKSRTKSIFSIWTKMRKSHIPFEEVFDIFALRIIVDCPREIEKTLCWNIYSVVTDFYTPNPERMRDWISIPKSNGYESLHTTVVTKEGRWVEVQIRSERMDEVAERGIAAHWRYKGVNQGAQTSEQWLGRLRELMETTTHSLVQRFDAKPASGEIFVFTPKGDLRKLPEGATVLDFAFDIHSNVGCTCSGAKINHRNVSIREVLRNGDIVEIITQKNQTPKSDWLNVVTTNKARNKIRQFLREEQARQARLGREELERKLKNWKMNIAIDDAVVYLCKSLKIRTGTELYNRILNEKIDFAQIKEIITRHLSGEADEQRRTTAAAIDAAKLESTKVYNMRPSGDALVIDDRISKIDYKLAKCCNPIMGDEVFGFVTINAGITIHRTDCPNAARLRENYPYRIMEARWREQVQGGAFRASIKIVAEDTTGMVNRITEVVNRDLKLNIRSMNLSSSGGTLSGLINVEVPSTNVVDMLIHSILRIRGVQRAYRVNN